MDFSGILPILKLLRDLAPQKSNDPSLRIQLLAPRSTKHIRIPRARNWRADVQRILAVEAQVRSDANWLQELGTCLGVNHQRLTNSLRRIPFTFEITNTGRSPAQGVSIELELPPTAYQDSGPTWPLPVPRKQSIAPGKDDLPDSLFFNYDKLEKFNLYPDYKKMWYPGATFPEATVRPTQVETVPIADAPERRKAVVPALEHGAAVTLRTIWLHLDPECSSSFKIAYRLHASNQQEDSRGAWTFNVREFDASAQPMVSGR